MKRLRGTFTLAFGWVFLACGGRAASPEAPEAAAPRAAAADESPPQSAADESAPQTAAHESDPAPHDKPFAIDPVLAHVLAESGLAGAIALYDVASRRLLCSKEEACDELLGPASTFKIPHTLIGLELGELSSGEQRFKWDGQQYSVEAWNQDHTLRSAMEVSCVPCFQQLARKIGEERMSEALRKLDYGNATIGAPIDMFWLEGGLKISPRQQLEFLYQLKTRALPFAEEAMQKTIDLIPKTETGGYVLRGKTGMLGSEPPVGWYVGWLEWEKGTTFFATALFGENDRNSLPAARRAVTVEALRRFTKLAALK